MNSSIPFQVPQVFARGLADGSIQRFGTLLKDSQSGKILAHVQETGVVSRALSSASGVSPFSILNPVTTASTVAANVQLSQIKLLIHGLQMLQFASLGATLAGIGVSVAGFVNLRRMTRAVSEQISDVAERIEFHFLEQREASLRKRMSHIDGLIEYADVAYSLKDPAARWRQLHDELLSEAHYFRGELKYLLERDEINLDLFESFTQSYALCSAAAVECLVQAGELPAARDASAKVSNDYNMLFDVLSPIKLAHRVIGQETKPKKPAEYALSEVLPRTRNFVSVIREAQDAALCKPYLLNTLIEGNIDGRLYLQQLREEQEHPLMLLHAT